MAIGAGLLVFLVLLRALNIYGDPLRWSRQESVVNSILSFVNVTKYPPSLLYLSMTLGTAMILMAWLEGVKNRFTQFLGVYGKVPFFYYVLHFYLIRLVCLIAFFASGFTSKDMITPNSPMLFRPATFGFSLPVVYLIWAGVVLLLYYPCRSFGRYKDRHKEWWLSYL